MSPKCRRAGLANSVGYTSIRRGKFCLLNRVWPQPDTFKCTHRSQMSENSGSGGAAETKSGRNSLGNAYTSLWASTVAQLRNQVASTDPTPGGGSVSIVAATLGIALIHKSIAVSLKRSATDFARHQSLLDLSSSTSALMISLSELADADSRAFQSYLEACSLPRATE